MEKSKYGSREHRLKCAEALHRFRASGGRSRKSGLCEKAFWKRVKKSNKCWIWTGAIRSKKSPYGVIRVDNKRIPAHRASWIISNGKIPEGLLVCHHCDNPSEVKMAEEYINTMGISEVDIKTRASEEEPPSMVGKIVNWFTNKVSNAEMLEANVAKPVAVEVKEIIEEPIEEPIEEVK